MDEYAIVQQIEADEATTTVDLRGQQARDANQTGDNYVLVTVLFASVLFVAGVSTKVHGRRSRRSSSAWPPSCWWPAARSS
jgi:hypothetical protein